MANAFQKMLEQFGLTEKILSVNADNASPNNTLTTKLDQLDNAFEEENQARCFNHTLQLSAKALLKPFNVGLSGKVTDNENESAQEDDGNLVTFEDDEEDEEEDEEEHADEEDVEDDNIDELEVLGEDEQKRVLEETAVVRETVT